MTPDDNTPQAALERAERYGRQNRAERMGAILERIPPEDRPALLDDLLAIEAATTLQLYLTQEAYTLIEANAHAAGYAAGLAAAQDPILALAGAPIKQTH